MRIPPLIEVVVVQVHAAGVGHLAVYDHNFAVILAIDAHQERAEAIVDMRIGQHFHAGLGHFTEIGTGNVPAYHVVVQEADLNPFLYLLQQGVPHFHAGFVVAKTEILNVNELLRLTDILQKKFPLAEAGSDDFHGIALVHAVAVPAGAEELCQGTKPCIYLFRRAFREQPAPQFLRHLPEQVEGTAVQALTHYIPPVVDSEQAIGN